MPSLAKITSPAHGLGLWQVLGSESHNLGFKAYRRVEGLEAFGLATHEVLFFVVLSAPIEPLAGTKAGAAEQVSEISQLN